LVDRKLFDGQSGEFAQPHAESARPQDRIPGEADAGIRRALEEHDEDQSSEPRSFDLAETLTSLSAIGQWIFTPYGRCAIHALK
jgi:hypothetical protein